MSMITTRYDIGDYVTISTPGIKAQVVGIRITGYAMMYHCLYWIDNAAEVYEAYDYELEPVD